MCWIDWLIVFLFIIVLTSIAFYAKQFNRGVVDFLAANRCAGRYLLGIASGIAALGSISFVAYFEMYFRAGFSGIWWTYMLVPIAMLVSMSGWVRYRYRETRVLTLAQLFEVRYSRKFRIFAGILIWVSGIVNMGIYPAVNAKLLMYFCGLPETFSLFGIPGISTFVVIMILELSIAIMMIFLGGMVVIVITDFFQGVFCNIIFIAALVFLIWRFDWEHIMAAMHSAPDNASMINPFKTSKVDGFSLAYFLMSAFAYFYGWQAWQGSQGFAAAAKNAHEGKMAGIIGGWRMLVQNLIVALLPICMFVFLNHSEFGGAAQEASSRINAITDVATRSQMTVVIAMTKLFPVGFIGLFAAVFIAAAVTTDNSYLHSWGSIFIQDVILPFKKKPLKTAQHLWLLRFSILFVAVFIFLFSLLFKQTDFIMMFFQITGAIYMGGAGVVLIGALYWKRGTTSAAWSAMITGGVLSVGGIILRSQWQKIVSVLLRWLPDNEFLTANLSAFPLNGMEISFYASLAAIFVYIVISLLGWWIFKTPPFNLHKMLHRGEYAIEGEHETNVALPPVGLKALLPSKEFTGKDRILYYMMLIWGVGWAIFFIAVAIYHFLVGTTDSWWEMFWRYYVWIIASLGIAATIWFCIGGIKDLKYMLLVLKTTKRNSDDTGRVTKERMNDNDKKI